MAVGDDLLELTLEAKAHGVFIVGTAKNVGKTVTMRALIAAAARRELAVGITSTGRDGEAVDAVGAHAKPRLFLTPSTVFATARGLLPSHPACEILVQTPWLTASGPVVIARVRRPGYFELAGPSAARGIREVVQTMRDLGSRLTIVDGALDRIAALGGGGYAILAAGAASAATMQDAAEDAGALAARLRIPLHDPQKPAVRLPGALTASAAARLARAGEARQIVLRDATQLVAPSRAIAGILERLDVRCEQPITALAVTVASIAPERYFEPREFARAVAESTQLPVFDVYADESIAA